jgi:tetratricopeptide (TPR) repeat protein
MIRDLLRRLASSVRGHDPDPTVPGPSRTELKDLETEAAAAAPQRRAQLFNRLGDAYVRTGERGAAVRAFGNAIDGYLENGFYDAAAALCRKLIAYEPSVIRARCTLAFLSLGKDMPEDARRELGHYARAARTAAREDLAIARLRLLAEATDSFEIRSLLGEVLLELGDAEGADRVLGAVHAERSELIAPPMDEQRERWARLLRVRISEAPDEHAPDGRRFEPPR